MGEEKAMGMEVEMQEDERGEWTRRSSSKDGSSSVVRWQRFLPKMEVRVLLKNRCICLLHLSISFSAKWSFRFSVLLHLLIGLHYSKQVERGTHDSTSNRTLSTQTKVTEPTS